MNEQPLQPNQFRCDRCGGVFNRGWSEEESRAEQVTNLPEIPPSDRDAVLCDDCYEVFMEWYKNGGKEIVTRELN